MGRIKIRYFVEKAGAAGPRYFWQPAAALRAHGWQMHRLPDDRGQAVAKAELLNREVDAWRRGEPPPAAAGVPKLRTVEPNTLAHIIRGYERSRFFTELRDRTKRGYRQNMRVLEEWGGDMRVASITPQTVETLYTSLYARTPAKAGAVVTMLRILLEAARRQNQVTTNAAARAGIKGRPPSGRIWPREAVTLFAEAADAAGWHSVGTFVVINHWLGQREGDILALPRSAIAGGRLHVRQSKTGARVSLPDNKAVRERIAAELARQETAQEARQQALRDAGAIPLENAPQPSPAQPLLICEGTGKPWTEHYFRHVFATIRATLAATHPTIAHPDGTEEQTARLLLMHLRHTAVTEMAVAGCTAPQIAGFTGHTLTSVNNILMRYLSLTAELADTTAAKRNTYEASLIQGGIRAP